MKVAISQSNYIPWKGYFDIINAVDLFVLYDCMQYTRRDWRNRNKIKTKNGILWLSIPVEVKGKYTQSIKETKIADSSWNKLHWESIKHAYSKAKYFKAFKDFFEHLYLSKQSAFLSEVNFRFLCAINELLGIKTKLCFSSEFNISGDRTQKLLSICKQCNANIYVSSPGAKGYFDENLAKDLGIKIQWANFDNYKQYSQLYPPFVHEVSILDLIFNEGNNAMSYLKQSSLFNDCAGGGGIT